MSIIISTNITSQLSKANTESASALLDSAKIKLGSGYRIQDDTDNGASKLIADNWDTQLHSIDVIANNITLGAELLSTLQDGYNGVLNNLFELKNIVEEENFASENDIQKKVLNKFNNIESISEDCDMKTKMLINDSQTGLNFNTNFENVDNNELVITNELLEKFNIKDFLTLDLTDKNLVNQIDADKDTFIESLELAQNDVEEKLSGINTLQDKIQNAISQLDSQSEIITSTKTEKVSLEESSTVLSSQIFQQAIATLLATANQTPSATISLV